jgi:hypothetical protein
MLPGTVPVFNTADPNFLAPSQAAGNDSFVKSLLHLDCPASYINSLYVRDTAYGAPSRAASWSLRAGAPVSSHSANSKFSQYVFFPGGGGGNNSSLQCPHALDLCPAGDFTIDGWVFPVSAMSAGFYGKVSDTTGIGPFLFYQSNSSPNHFLFFSSSNGTAWDIVSAIDLGSIPSANVWYHLAFVRKGNTYYAFQNGVLQSTGPFVGVPWQGNCPLVIGAQGSTNYWYGAMDEWRLSNGIARWTANFSPPNEPYKSKLTGNDDATKLLLHFDHDFNDVAKGSFDAPHAFTNAGMTFAGSGTALFSNVTATTGPATRIYTAAGNSPDFDFFGANWTIDFWYYRIAAGGGNVHLAGKRWGNGAFAPWMIMDNTNVITFLGSVTGSAWDVNFSFGAAPLNAWTHIAVMRNGPWITGCLNGVQGGGQNIGASKLWMNGDYTSIGGNDTVSMSCYLDEFRISDVCRWPTSPFTPPSQPYA